MHVIICNTIIIKHFRYHFLPFFFKLNVSFNKKDYLYLDFSLVWYLLENTSPLKEFHQNNNINVAGNNTTVLKHTNH